MVLLHPALISSDMLSSRKGVGCEFKLFFLIANMENGINTQEEDLPPSKNCIFLLIRLMSEL